MRSLSCNFIMLHKMSKIEGQFLSDIFKSRTVSFTVVIIVIFWKSIELDILNEGLFNNSVGQPVYYVF